MACFISSGAYLERPTRAFRRALDDAQRSGEIDEHADLDELAAFFTTTLIGVAACVRAEARPEQVHAASKVATSVLDASQVRPGSGPVETRTR